MQIFPRTPGIFCIAAGSMALAVAAPSGGHSSEPITSKPMPSNEAIKQPITRTAPVFAVEHHFIQRSTFKTTSARLLGAVTY
jgi:hypothetical protein